MAEHLDENCSTLAKWLDIISNGISSEVNNLTVAQKIEDLRDYYAKYQRDPKIIEKITKTIIDHNILKAFSILENMRCRGEIDIRKKSTPLEKLYLSMFRMIWNGGFVSEEFAKELLVNNMIQFYLKLLSCDILINELEKASPDSV